MAWNPEYVVGVWCGHVTGGFGDTSLVGPVLKAMLAAQYGTRDYFTQVLSWGGDTMMGDAGKSRLFIDLFGDVVSDKTAGGEKSQLDFAPLILGASRAGNLESFRQIASLQDKLSPFQGGGKPYPASDFGGQLLSSEGLLCTSSTCSWDHPANYARGIDDTPCKDGAFHTDREKAPWAKVMLRGPSEVLGVVVENRGGWQNRHRQVPLQVEVSEDGDTWNVVYEDDQIRETYRVDLRRLAPRARLVRVRRKPDAKNEFFHLYKILVYGKKLY